MSYETNPGKPSLIEIYNLHRSLLDRENENMNQKVIWHVISQSFFFSAYSSLLNAPAEAKNQLFAHQQVVLAWVLPLAALFLAVLMVSSIFESAIEYWRIQSRFKNVVKTQAEYLPPISRRPVLQFIGLVTPVAIPLFLIVVWIMILAYEAGWAP